MSSHLHTPVSPADHIKGSANAPIVVVEYGDYQCPHCGAAHHELKRSLQGFGKDVALVFRNFPIVDSHPEAQNAAIVTEFAATHGKFWEAHDALFEHQQSLGDAYYARLVESLGLSLGDLQKAIATDAFEKRIRTDIEGGLRSGVNGTPTFFINGERFDSPGGYQDLAPVIEELLRPTR